MGNLRPVIIVGAGGHGRVILDSLLSSGRPVKGFLDSHKAKGTAVALGYSVVGSESEIRNFVADCDVVVGIGDGWIRSQIVNKLKEISPSIQFTSVIHPSAVISQDVEIRPGTVVMAGAVINIGSRIGEHVIVNTRASVDHDCNLSDFSAVQPGATLGGNVELGEFTVVALGSKIIHGKKVDMHSVIGAGATVVSDVPAFSICMGTPAKVTSNREKGERYL